MSEIIANLIAKNRALEKRLNYLETQENNSSGEPAADILTKLLTVDGSGSGLDADLLDGYHASSFSLSSHNHDSVYGRLAAANAWTQPNTFAIAGGNFRISASYYGPDIYVNTSGGWARHYTLRNDYAGASLRFGIGAFGGPTGATRGYMVFRDGDEELYLSTLGINILSSGNVGIGTLTPDVHLVAYSNSTNPAIKVEAGASGGFPVYQFIDGRAGGVNWNIEDGRVTGALGFYQSGGGTRLLIDSSGKVGINTTSPGYGLTIYQRDIALVGTLGMMYMEDNGATINFTRPSANYIRATDAAGSLIFATAGSNRLTIGSAGHFTFASPSTAAPLLTLGRYSGQPTIRSSDTYLLMDSNGAAAGLNYWSTDPVVLAYGNGAGGGVAIGKTTITAGYKLDVNGAVTLNSHFYQATTDARYYIGTGGTLRFLDASSSYNLKLGIGTTPQRQLHVYGAGSVLAIDAPATSDSDIDFFSAGAVKSSIYRPANTNDLRVWTNSVGDIMTFGYSSGNVGIGTTNPQGRIHAYNGYGGFMFVSRTGVSTVAQTIIPNSIGDVTNAVLVVGYIKDSGGTYINLNTRVNISTTVLVGNFSMDVAGDGTFTIKSTSGSLTFDFHAICIWS